MRHAGDVTETATPTNPAGPRPEGAPGSRRAPLTHVPLSRTPLPPHDPTLPPWPGARERAGEAELYVRRTPGADDATVVYVHGLGGSSTNWTDLAAQLAPHATGLAVDLPGFGFSQPTEGFGYRLEDHAEALARYLETCEEPVHLVGNSMGGAVALLIAARRPELVRTLTLVSPAMPDRRPDPRRLSDPRMALAFLPFVGKPVRRRLARLTPEERALQTIRLVFADAERFPQQRITEQAEEFVARSSYAWSTTAMARSTLEIFRSWCMPGPRSLWSAAPRVQAPTLVVWGSADRVISVRRARRTAEVIPSARLLVLPRTGHVAQMERPVTVAKAVLGMWEYAAEGRW